jgi:eukaryotic-like serine/threonine-protein kinase
MSYCLNPNCHKPQNLDGEKICQACGSQLLLKDRYRAISFLDSGGMSRNFLAIDTDMPEEKWCAIKQFFPAPQVLDDPEAFQKSIELFQREGEQLDRLGDESSKRIPQLYAYFEQERRFYLIQEFIDGQNLLKELDKNGAYSETQIRELLDDLLPILRFVHDRGVIHRDIKPENIMRRANGQLVLIDFGMSKHLNSTVLSRGTTGGTMGYAPPEQIRAGVAYPASDIYALGATCIHLLTDVTPDRLYDFMANKWTWREHLAEQERSISDRLGYALDRMLMTEVQDRHQSIACIVETLDAPPVNKWPSRAALVGSLAVVGALGVLAHVYRDPIECYIGGNNQLCPLPALPRLEIQTKPEKLGDISYYPYLKITDRQGKSAEINMAVISDSYEWQRASIDRVRQKGQDRSEPLSILKQKLIDEGNLKTVMGNNPDRIIVLGMASCEGSNTPEEEVRASNRANTVREQIVKPLFEVDDIRILNLGRFKQGQCLRDSPATSKQRKLVIVGMRKESPGLEVKEAVYTRLSKTIKDMNLEYYTLGGIDKFELKQ